jgi:hypothetical protein
MLRDGLIARQLSQVAVSRQVGARAADVRDDVTIARTPVIRYADPAGVPRSAQRLARLRQFLPVAAGHAHPRGPCTSATDNREAAMKLLRFA